MVGFFACVHEASHGNYENAMANCRRPVKDHNCFHVIANKKNRGIGRDEQEANRMRVADRLLVFRLLPNFGALSLLLDVKTPR